MLAEICSKTYYEISATNMSDVRKIFTTNYMMETTSPYYYKRVKGLKTGYTEKAGRCLVSYAEKDGAEYIGVVMGCKTKDETETSIIMNSTTPTRCCAGHLQI